MRLINGFVWFLYKIALLFTLLVYALAYWSITSHWLVGFMLLTLPFLFVFHLLFLVVWAVFYPKRILVTLVILGLGYPFLERTFQWNSPEEATDEKQLKVMSYNALRFNMYDFRSGEKPENTVQARAWLAQQDADVICFQEFYHYDNSPVLDFASLLRKAGYKYHAHQDLKKENLAAYELGVAVYSKFPIIARQDTFFGGQNGMLQADILWNRDTIRIMDVHLYSMTLKLDKLTQQERYEGMKRETRVTLRQMRQGYVERAKQVALLEKWIKSSPESQPIIVCGDFNETPYSYVYGRVRGLLSNAFEEKGRGFGFTYNRLPYFIRIDHQFYSRDQFRLHDFKVLKSIPYSDHYPIVGTYSYRQRQN